MFGWLKGIVGKAIAVASALVFCQVPQFIQQYTNRLAGHVGELKYQIELLHKAAALSGKSLDQYMNRFLSSSDIDFSQQGFFMQNMVDRYQSLQTSLQSLQEASIGAKPFVFLFHVNYEIAKNALHDFKPGLAFTVESAVYALVGIVFVQVLTRFAGNRKKQDVQFTNR